MRRTCSEAANQPPGWREICCFTHSTTNPIASTPSRLAVSACPCVPLACGASSGRLLTSPVLQAEEVVEVVADEGRYLLQVVGADTGREERLVGVPEGGVHEQKTSVGAHGLGESLGTVAQQHVAETHWRLAWQRSGEMSAQHSEEQAATTSALFGVSFQR